MESSGTRRLSNDDLFLDVTDDIEQAVFDWARGAATEVVASHGARYPTIVEEGIATLTTRFPNCPSIPRVARGLFHHPGMRLKSHAERLGESR